jgi:hypothetical protein
LAYDLPIRTITSSNGATFGEIITRVAPSGIEQFVIASILTGIDAALISWDLRMIVYCNSYIGKTLVGMREKLGSI